MNCQLVYLHVLACSGAYSNCKYMQIINSGIFLATYFWIKISGKRHLFLRDAKVLLRDSICNTPPSKDTKPLLKRYLRRDAKILLRDSIYEFQNR